MFFVFENDVVLVFEEVVDVVVIFLLEVVELVNEGGIVVEDFDFIVFCSVILLCGGNGRFVEGEGVVVIYRFLF